MDKFSEKLAQALKRVGFHKGLEFDEEYGFMTNGKSTNDYLVVLYLAQLLENGQMEIKINPSKIEYLFKLLYLREEEKC